MEAEIVAKPQAVNPCCVVLKEKYSKLEASRNALRQGVKIQNELIDKLQKESLNFKKEVQYIWKRNANFDAMKSVSISYEEERVQADAERQEKANESAIRVSLENEISSLKSEILSLHQRGGSLAQDVDGEVILLRTRLSEMETEIKRFEELVKKERMETDSERRKADAERKEANEARKIMKAEKSRAAEVRRLADIERKKVEENRIQLEKLKSEADEARSKLVLEAFKSEEANKKIQAEKQKVIKEKKRADSKRAKVEELRKLVEINQKKAMDEKCRADNLSQQVEEHRQGIERLRKEIDELVSLRKLVEAPDDLSDKCMNDETAKVKGGFPAGKSSAAEERRLADIERKKVEENLIQLEKLKREADDARSKLVLETFKSEEANKKIEAEKKKVITEKKRADSEMAKAEELRKFAEINQKKVMDEKCRADYLSQQVEEHRQRIERLQRDIDELVPLRKFVEAPDKCMNAEAAEVKGGLRTEILEREADESKLVLEYLKSEQVNKRLKEEKQKVIREKKRADSERRKAEEQRKVAETNKKAAMEERHRANQLAQQLEDNKRRIEELQEEILELVSSRTLVEAPAVLPDKNMNSETAIMKLQGKKLKFKKKQVKHAKKVTEFEICRNNILQQELCCLRQGFVQFSHRLDVLNNYFSHRGEGSDDLVKTGNIFNTPSLNLRRERFSKKQRTNELIKPICTAMDASDFIKQTIERTAPSLPISGGNCTRCISGIDSKLEPLIRGSNRKMLQRSAINSSTASFSDRQLTRSQERGAFSVTTSAKLAEEKSNSQPNVSSLSGEVTKTRYNENLAVVAENSVRSPISTDTVGRAGHSKKRKRILDAVKSVEHLYSEGKEWHLRIEEKLSMLHGILNSQMDKSLQEERCGVPYLECDLYAEQVKAHKKRKASPIEEVALQHLCESNDRKDRFGTRGIKEGNICNQTFPPTTDPGGTAQVCKDGIGDSGRSNQENLGSFKEELEGNFMKLLDLDNAVDEGCYRRAIEMPLSPTLPVIEFQNSVEINSTKCLVDECSYEGFLSEKVNPVSSCSFDVINVEIDPSKLKLNSPETSHVPSVSMNEGVIHSFKNVTDKENGAGNTVYEDNACAWQTWDSRAELGMSDLCSSGYKGTNISYQSALGLACDELPRYCVVFSDTKDSSSISRIFRVTGTIMGQCSMISLTDHLMQNIVPALLKIEDLLPKEKACVFFSVLLHNFSGRALENFGNLSSTDSTFLLDSFAGCLHTVMSDVETRSAFTELCFFGELLVLVEDFLLDRRVLVCSNVSSESLPKSGSSVNILLNEEEIILSHGMAPTHQLVAGAIVLASICATTDHIGFLCEASYNIFRMQNLDTSLMLTVLHVFAHMCGSKYFNLTDYSLLMTVMKSLVTFLEREKVSSDYIYCIPSADEVRSELPLCTKCPFSKGAVSMDIVISMLFEKLQNHVLSIVVRQDLMESVNSLNSEPDALSRNEKIKKTSGHEGAFGIFSMNCSGSSCLNKFGMPTTHSNSTVDENLCHFTDVLSLVELVACNMSWDWTCNNILSQMLKLLESCFLENFSTVTIVLLGKLGRLGVDASGYGNNGVENLKIRLSAFLCQSSSRKLGLPSQIATANALLGLLPLNFKEIIKYSLAELPAVVSQSDPADCIIRKWFSMLSSEQQSLSFSLLQSSGVKSRSITG
ncbi:uncharacterized protein LOC114287088 isoform X1 [Camellia sinensis]|uniref:uncharacterized protein LOC114287088 isoform X1 n=1 Tax=Camellia sinensis TaxID=4442 RepID=UPI0010360006|nr:uncharacterized protein LOC114287088 isoform X1 [Camellia sinensis]